MGESGDVASFEDRTISQELWKVGPYATSTQRYTNQEKIGDLRCRQCLQAIDEGHMEQAAALLLYYYDKTYTNALARRGEREIFSVNVTVDDLESTANAILQASDRMTLSE